MINAKVFSLLLKAPFLTRSLREPGGPCTKSMEVLESHMEWVNAAKEEPFETCLGLNHDTGVGVVAHALNPLSTRPHQNVVWYNNS